MSCCVSVILPRLPDGVPIQRTLNSIRRQTLKDVEIVSAAPIDAEIASEYDHLTACESFEEAVSRAAGRYIYFMHPEGVLAFSALQRLLDTIDGHIWAVCQSVTRRDGKAFESKNDALSLVHASLFDGDYVKGVVSSGRIGGLELELLPQFMRHVERVSYDGILVYIDEFGAVSEATTPEMAAARVREYTGMIVRNMERSKRGANYSLFVNHVLRYFIYFDTVRRASRPDAVMPLFDALSAFIQAAEAQGDLIRFIKQIMDPRDVELFLLPAEAFALLSPSRTVVSVKPAAPAAAKTPERLIVYDIKAMKDDKAVRDTDAGAGTVVIADPVSQFAQGRAGMRTLIRCFLMWINFKLRGEKLHG